MNEPRTADWPTLDEVRDMIARDRPNERDMLKLALLRLEPYDLIKVYDDFVWNNLVFTRTAAYTAVYNEVMTRLERGRP